MLEKGEGKKGVLNSYQLRLFFILNCQTKEYIRNRERLPIKQRKTVCKEEKKYIYKVKREHI